jgi:hypothetical protein
MQDLTEKNFGYLIAFIVPGFVAVKGLSYHIVVINAWLNGPLNGSPSVGGFLFATLGSIALGLVAHTARWLLFDPLCHLTGIRKPTLDYSRLKDCREAFDYINEQHGRYYQFYGNTIVSTIFTYTMRQTALHRGPIEDWAITIAVLFLVVLFFLGARDSLRKTYDRMSAVIPTNKEEQL